MTHNAKWTMLGIVAAALGFAAGAQAADNLTEQVVTLAADLKTVEGPAATFTGKVTVTGLYGTFGDMKSSGGSVTFQPGARSVLHYHPVGQVLIVTDGVGYTQEWANPALKSARATSSVVRGVSTGTARVKTRP